MSASLNMSVFGYDEDFVDIFGLSRDTDPPPISYHTSSYTPPKIKSIPLFNKKLMVGSDGPDTYVTKTGKRKYRFSKRVRDVAREKAVVEAAIRAGVRGKKLDYILNEHVMFSVVNWAVIQREQEILKALIENQASLDNCVGGYTPLINALKMDDSEAIDILARAGANIDIQDIDGFTALDYVSNKPDTREFLVATKEILESVKEKLKTEETPSGCACIIL